MDITFICEKCGQNIVIDEAGGGITVDCPQCGRLVYVPSPSPPSAKNAPVRIETTSTRTSPVATPVSRPVSRSATPATIRKREDIHPSIVASLQCLIIGAALFFVCFLVFHQNPILAPVFLYMALPFAGAAPWCAIYGMCVGHVKQGLLLLAAMSLGIGIISWVFFSTMQSLVPQFSH